MSVLSMSAKGDFECLQCSKCCRSILETSGGVTRGLALTEREAKIFPPEIVSPKLAVGVSEPSVVILYQLNVTVCPYVNDYNQCSRYEERPLICRSFPIVGGAISNRCRIFSYRKPGVVYAEPFNMDKQMEASRKLNTYTRNRISKHYQKGLKIWEYDIATKKWISKGEYDPDD